MKILTNKQIQILNFLSRSNFFSHNFYFTGGTALAEIYLKHRLSEDLDFFSDDLYSDEVLLGEINKLKSNFKIKQIKYQKDKNRQIFNLIFSDKDIIKLEFVYFPFGKLMDKKISKEFNIRVDSVKSVAENKILALYENVGSKHIFDLYWIAKKNKNLSLKKLHSGAIKKFGVEIDKVIFLEKSLEAIDKIDKIQPLILSGFEVAKKQLIDFVLSIK
ncbi:MAG: hypothetical protein ACD_58C00297G0008 [uncultured bacterium]|nr:MAG: hypothetical protein ACD_58C00297G0008 [uncultured bacterium]